MTLKRPQLAPQLAPQRIEDALSADERAVVTWLRQQADLATAQAQEAAQRAAALRHAAERIESGEHRGPA